MATPTTNLFHIDATREPRTRVSSSDTTLVESGKGKTIASAVTAVELVPLRRIQKEDTKSVRLSQDDLYPARRAFSREHITALRLLKLAIGRCRRAIEAQADDPMAADIEIQKIQMLLPELFCCRKLGDGFATIVNSLLCAFENASGNTLARTQIGVLGRIFDELRDKPFLSASEADAAVELLESSGFDPYPSELVEFLSSDPSLR
jgi:hypothetical protein